MLRAFFQSSFLGYFLAVLGIVASIYFGVRSKRIKRITYYRQTKRLILPGDRIKPELHVFYASKEIDNISVSLYTLWNSGNETLQSDDIVSSKPIEILVDESGEILDAQIVKQSEDSCDFNIVTEEKRVTLNFDYIDKADGVVVQIIHTGSLGELSGRIKGGRTKEFRFHRDREKIFVKTKIKQKTIMQIVALFTIVLALFLVFLSCLYTARAIGVVPEDSDFFNYWLASDPPTQFRKITSAIVYWISCYLYIEMFRDIFMKYFQLGIPSKLRLQNLDDEE